MNARTLVLACAGLVAASVGCYTILGIEQVSLDPGSDAGVPDVVAPPVGCEKSPKDDPATLVDRCGVFVSPTGSDSAPGTREAPMKTLQAAVSTAVQRRLFRVYACAVPYAERVSLAAGQDVSLFGGLVCPGAGDAWSYTGQPALVRPTEPGFALRVDGIVSSISIEDFQFNSADAVAPGASSVATFVTASADVTLRRVLIVAGVGQPGVDGDAGAPQTSVPEAGSGNPGSGTTAGASKSCTCVPSNQITTGGQGGAGTAPQGAPGSPGSPDGGVGGVPGGNCNNTGSGGGGADGGAGSPAPAATAVGEIDPAGWHPAPGGPGGTGAVGAGGGGGRGFFLAFNNLMQGGGGGGCGGCGGGGGAGGTGGGASIGVLVEDAKLSLLDCTISTKNGGAGGAGGQGAQGEPGSPGGGGAGNACRGGAGGSGGSGAAGGGGAGGVSVGVLFKGTPPVIDPLTQAKITTGTSGAGGAGSTPGTTGAASATLKL